MANGNITLLAPNISDDDRLWIARCDWDGLRSFIENPIAWVADLSRDPQGKPRYELTSNYVVEFRPKLPTPQPATHIVIEGISHTPFVTVRIPVGAPTPPADLAMWDAWGNEDVEIRGVENEGLIYGHLKLVDANDPQPVRSAKLFQALAVLSCDLSLMNRLLAARPRSVIFVTPIPSVEGTAPVMRDSLPVPITFAPIQEHAEGVTIVMEGDSESPLESCMMFVASQPNPNNWALIETMGVKTYYPLS